MNYNGSIILMCFFFIFLLALTFISTKCHMCCQKKINEYEEL